MFNRITPACVLQDAAAVAVEGAVAVQAVPRDAEPRPVAVAPVWLPAAAARASLLVAVA